MEKKRNAGLRLISLLQPEEAQQIWADLGITKQAFYAALRRKEPSHPAVKKTLELAEKSGALAAAQTLQALA